MNPHIPCVSCLAPCCFRHIVAVTGYDAWRISTRLRLPMEEFLIFGHVPGEERVSFRLRPGGEGYILALAKKRGKAKAQNRPCSFLVQLPGGFNRCGIYEHRPLACQIYPFAVRNGVVLMKPDHLCPPRGWNLAEIDHDEVRVRVLRFTMEYDTYAFVVRTWNRFVDAGSPDHSLHVRAYLAYLSNAYAALERTRGAIPADAWSGILRQWAEASARGEDPLTTEVDDSLPRGLDPWTDWIGGVRQALGGLLTVAAPQTASGGHPAVATHP